MSLEQKNATVIFNNSQQSPESLSEAIEDMGFDSSMPESSTATPVSTDTQVIPTLGLKPAAQQEALEKLSRIQGVLDVRKNPTQMDLAVTFVPSLTSLHHLNEVVSSLMLLESHSPRSPMQKDPTLSPSQATGGGVSFLKFCIEGMTCHSCTTTIEGKIGKLNGVEKIKGDVHDQFTDLYSCLSLLSKVELRLEVEHSCCTSYRLLSCLIVYDRLSVRSPLADCSVSLDCDSWNPFIAVMLC